MALAAFVTIALAATGAIAAERSAHVNFLLRCSGCHMSDGSGVPASGIPPFPGFIDSFAADPDGRTYMAHVPGVIGSGLSDAEIAAVLNYLIDKWGRAPEAVDRFTADEVAARRAAPVPDVVAYRRALVVRLTAAGSPVAQYPWP